MACVSIELTYEKPTTGGLSEGPTLDFCRNALFFLKGISSTFINHYKTKQQMRKLILFLMASLLLSVLAKAQSREVTGKVTDSAGNPLTGASINVKGARGGTSAGPDGSFRINVPAGRNTLVVSAVGFSSQDVPIGSGGALSVTMIRDTRNMNEVVVTALGIRKEKRS